MEQDRFGTTVFMGKENKKMVMVRIERRKILNDAEMMRYMEDMVIRLGMADGGIDVYYPMCQEQENGHIMQR